MANDIAKVNINEIDRKFYSSAIKYCSHHYPKIFSIYDSYVEKCLLYLYNIKSEETYRRRDSTVSGWINLTLKLYE